MLEQSIVYANLSVGQVLNMGIACGIASGNSLALKNLDIVESLRKIWSVSTKNTAAKRIKDAQDALRVILTKRGSKSTTNQCGTLRSLLLFDEDTWTSFCKWTRHVRENRFTLTADMRRDNDCDVSFNRLHELVADKPSGKASLNEWQHTVRDRLEQSMNNLEFSAAFPAGPSRARPEKRSEPPAKQARRSGRPTEPVPIAAPTTSHGRSTSRTSSKPDSDGSGEKILYSFRHCASIFNKIPALKLKVTVHLKCA